MPQSLPPPQTRPVTLRARPLLFVSTFLIVHQAIATSSLFPTFAFFQSTDSANTLLAGPTAAWALKQHVPLAAKNDDGQPATVQDVLERGLRRAIGGGWGLWRSWRARDDSSSSGGSDENNGIGKRFLQRWREHRDAEDVVQIAHQAVDGLEGRPTPGWRDRAVDRARGLRSKDVVDAAAAYVVVKALFPLRLAASLFLTPKIARFVLRR